MPETRTSFYRGEKNELEAIAMPMLDSYDGILCQASPDCLFKVAMEESWHFSLLILLAQS